MRHRLLLLGALAVVAVSVAATTGVTAGVGNDDYFQPLNLLVSRSVYDNSSGNVQVGAVFPPGCVTGCGSAIADGTYPSVWNNDTVDASFGITSPVFLDQVTPAGALVNTFEVPNSSQNGTPPTKDQLVTSFPSKSE